MNFNGAVEPDITKYKGTGKIWENVFVITEVRCYRGDFSIHFTTTGLKKVVRYTAVFRYVGARYIEVFMCP